MGGEKNRTSSTDCSAWHSRNQILKILLILSKRLHETGAFALLAQLMFQILFFGEEY